MKKCVLGALATVAVLCQFAHAEVLVSTIDGFYGGTYYDTPWLTVSNSTSYDFTNVVLTLTGYQGLNNGSSQSADLGTIGAGTTDTLVWSSVPGVQPVVNPTTANTNLFEDDYDDEYGSYSNPGNSACTINDTMYGVSQYYFCADTGNFYATLTATWNNPAYGGGSGTEIYSQFSPGEDPRQAATSGGKAWIRRAGRKRSTTITPPAGRAVYLPTSMLALLHRSARCRNPVRWCCWDRGFPRFSA
jgi:hypothetical protein